MMFSNSSSDYRPLFWVGNRPVGVALLLIGVHSVAMTAWAFCKFFNAEWIFAPLVFSNMEVLHRGFVWQLATYPFVAGPSVMFLIQMLMLFWFGPDVERFIGRSYFMGLYAALIVLPALALTAFGLLGIPMFYVGAGPLLFGVFIAFVAIYPNVEMFLIQISAKWLAVFLLAIYTLAFLAYHEMTELCMLWFSTAVAIVGVHSMGVSTGLGFMDRIGEWLQNRRAEQLARRNNLRLLKEQEKTQSIDSILDKISRHGMGSLTLAEKKTLEQASSELIKRDKPH